MKKSDYVLTILICLFCVLLSSTISLVKAEDPMDVSITLNASFESQNVMKMAYTLEDNDERVYQDYWNYREQIKNFYINNEIEEISEYAYRFDVSEEDNGRVVAYLVTNQDDSNYYDLYLQADGIIYPNSDMSFYFDGMLNIDTINNMSGFDTSEVTNMRGMFQKTGYNSEKFALDVSGWNTSNVENMSGMFNKTGYNSKFINLDLRNFNTSKVTTMKAMFQQAGYSNPDFTLDVSNFDTKNVTHMGHMFSQAGYSSTKYKLDLSNFDTSNVTTMKAMFQCAGYNTHDFTLDLSNFDTSKVTDMQAMFNQTGYNSTNLTINVDNFDTSNVTDMRSMFNHSGYSSTNFTLNVGHLDTSKVTDMGYMFNQTGYSSAIFDLDVSNFDTRNVTDMGDMFRCAGFNSENFTLDVSNFDTSKVTDMSYMFADTGYNSTILNIDLSGFDTSNVTNMEAMFYNTGINSTELDTSITIENPNTIYGLMFANSVPKEGSQIKVNYTKDTEELVGKMIATKSSNSNVVKGNLIVDVDNLAIGDEIHISGEKFNVISQTDDTITMLAQYNLSPEYKQSTEDNAVNFSDKFNLEYSIKPLEIDIQTWSTNPKAYINSYVEYLKTELDDDSIRGDLITLTELEDLGCIIPPNYSIVFETDRKTCAKSPYKEWLINDQSWWTRSNMVDFDEFIWLMNNSGEFSFGHYNDGYHNIRPVITLSKETLRKF